MQFSERMAHIKPSATLTINAKALELKSQGVDVTSLAIGEPNFPTPAHVCDAAKQAIDEGFTRYTAVPGIPPLREAIAGYFKRAYGVDVAPDCTIASNGGKQSLYNLFAALLNDGDEVLIPSPYWVSYPDMVYLNGGVPVAAAFNPLTDLANVKARKAAEQQDGGATVPMSAVGAGQPTQAYNPATGQFEMVPPAQNPNEALAVKSRAEQRAEAARQKRKKKIIIASIISGVVLLAIIFGVIYTMSRKSATEMGTVPTITATMTKAQAKEKVTSAGFNFVEMQDSDSGEPAGTFTKQSPKGDTQAVKGSDVKVWFSVGPKSVTVPDLSDYTQEDARNALEKLGFKVSSVTKTADSATIEKDKVVSTDPASGTSQPKGTTITLYISSGMTKVPDGLVGQPKDTVLDKLSSMKFLPVVEQEASDKVEKGSVTRVSPGSGELVLQGSQITVYVSTGKPQVSVPNLLGNTIAEAKATLGSDFTLKVTGDATDDAVIETQDPAVGTQVDKGSTISVTAKKPTTEDPDNNGNGGTTTGGN